MQPKRLSFAIRMLAFSAVALLTAQCGPPEPAPKPAPPPEPAPVPAPAPIAVAPPSLTRADLIAAAGAAASAYAAGASAAEAEGLAGRSFSIRVPFGCFGADQAEATDPADGLARWRRGPKGDTIRLSLNPADWTKAGPIAEAAPPNETEGWEAAEGFWITRPWLLGDACPAARPVDPAQAPIPASPETLGLVALFKSDESRFGRRNGRAYSFTQRAKGEAALADPAKGYATVFGGRIAAFPDGKAIHCRAVAANQRPVCIVAVQLDRVTFEDGATGDFITEWRDG